MILVIDGNAFMQVAVSVMTLEMNKSPYPMFKGDGKTMTDDAMFEMRKFVDTYLFNIVSPFKKNIDTLYMVFDSHSWRKMYVNQYFEKEENKDMTSFVYKGHREATEEDRKRKAIFINIMENFNSVILPDKEKIPGFKIVKCYGAEGDDLIAYVVNNFKDTDIMIWSMDSDLVQLLENGSRKVYMMSPKMSNTTKRLFIVNGSPEAVTESGVFDFLSGIESQISMNDIVKHMTTKGYSKEVVDPCRTIVMKIIAGDKKSDNIPSIYSWHAKSTVRNVSEKNAENIISILENKYTLQMMLEIMDNKYGNERHKEFFMDLFAALILVCKIKDPIAVRKNVVKMYNLNRKLIRLSMSNIPPKLLTMIDESFNKTKDGAKLNFSSMQPAY
jgi:5'-3' exonuclease